MQYRIEITGRRTDLGELTGVYTLLIWDLSADNDAGRIERTGGEVPLPAPAPEAFVPVEEVTDALKLQWLLAQYPEGWLAEQKAMLEARFAEPVVTADVDKAVLTV